MTGGCGESRSTERLCEGKEDEDADTRYKWSVRTGRVRAERGVDEEVLSGKTDDAEVRKERRRKAGGWLSKELKCVWGCEQVAIPWWKTRSALKKRVFRFGTGVLLFFPRPFLRSFWKHRAHRSNPHIFSFPSPPRVSESPSCAGSFPIIHRLKFM